MECWVEIIREDGTLERQRIEGEQVTCLLYTSDAADE